MNEGERQAGLAPTADYRYAERVGNQLFVAGQVPLDQDGNLVGLEDPKHKLPNVWRTSRRSLNITAFLPTTFDT